MKELRYPIGRFIIPENITDSQRQQWIQEIREAPGQLRKSVKDLTKEQTDTPYREGGWTIRQVVHHISDSHLNGYVRFKLALTEEQPLIRGYIQEKWANLEDTKKTPLEVSISLLESLHERWIVLLNSLQRQDFMKEFNHPESGLATLETALGLYAWHGRHHIAQITSLRKRQGW
ncbi:metal-dependent hydrolase [Domibacillus antri]|uniref:Putative metal-dependent hydrolase BTO30_14640 n=1 Tax=Domibacillus antri TaxID=1714264 RepID=A0A1Q8Q2F1_9BACI|nr:bacillithiol transferase BstA [Domibacillus antri]OLN21492.1 metal-dependent hydrolase [Domibacillus antri]